MHASIIDNLRVEEISEEADQIVRRLSGDVVEVDAMSDDVNHYMEQQKNISSIDDSLREDTCP